jgi:hypothetical protein
VTVSGPAIVVRGRQARCEKQHKSDIMHICIVAGVLEKNQRRRDERAYSRDEAARNRRVQVSSVPSLRTVSRSP